MKDCEKCGTELRIVAYDREKGNTYEKCPTCKKREKENESV